MFTLENKTQSPWKIICQSLLALKTIWLKCLPIVLLATAINILIWAGYFLSFDGMRNILLNLEEVIVAGSHIGMLLFGMLFFGILVFVVMVVWINAVVILKVESILFNQKQTYAQLLKNGLLQGLRAAFAWLIIIIVLSILCGIIFAIANLILNKIGIGIAILTGLLQFYIVIKLIPLTYLILNGASMKNAFRESKTLTNRHWWHTFCVIIMAGIVAAIFVFLCSLLLKLLSSTYGDVTYGMIAIIINIMGIVFYLITITVIIWNAIVRWLLINDLTLRKNMSEDVS